MINAEAIARGLARLAVESATAYGTGREGIKVTVKHVVADCWSVEVTRNGRPIDAYSRVFDGELSDLPIGMSGLQAAAKYLEGMAETFDGFVLDADTAADSYTLTFDALAGNSGHASVRKSVQAQVDRFRISRMSKPCRLALARSDEHGVLYRERVPLGVLVSIVSTHQLGTKLMQGYRCVGVQLSREGRRIAARLMVEGIDTE